MLVVDDDPDIRAVIRIILEASSGAFEIMGEAIDGDEALELFERGGPERWPDVVILDHRMPGRRGLDVARDILDHHPGQRMILFGTTITPKLEREALDAGVAACVGKLDVDRLPAIIGDVVAAVA